MREVLISIQPKWVEKICRKEKTVEVRKTRPKCETPFKVYIYETQGRTETPFVDEEGHYIFKGRGKVIGEFVCDHIYGLINFLPYDSEDCHHNIFPCVLEQTCLEDYEIDEYLGKKDGYGWHITDLVVYDEPKDLSQVLYRKQAEKCVNRCEHNGMCQYCKEIRPPQSWCYIESRQTAD